MDKEAGVELDDSLDEAGWEALKRLQYACELRFAALEREPDPAALAEVVHAARTVVMYRIIHMTPANADETLALVEQWVERYASRETAAADLARAHGRRDALLSVTASRDAAG